MKNTKRQAFTIVELVIVIAVIAILSAVLIPTFGSIIKNANIAADQATASTLTSELQVYLKGETIDSEEELMAALDESGVGVKLVPKALAYGYHFWFDMGTQTIFAAHPDEVEDMEPAKVTASAEQDGPALASATLIADEAITYANVGIRDVFDKGYFLITNCGDSDPLTKALSLVENLKNGEEYALLIDTLNNASADVANPVAELVLNKIKDTTIRTEGGVFFYDGASVYEHISSSAEYLAGNYFNYDSASKKVTKLEGEAAVAPNPTGTTTITLPDNIKFVMGDGINYATAEGTTIIVSSKEQAVNIFAPEASNALIKFDNTDHIITTTDACPDDPGKTCHVIVTQADHSVIVAHLELKLPYSDYTVDYIEEDANKATDVKWNDNKIYVAWRNGSLQLVAANTANLDETSNRVEKWEVLAGDYGTFEIDEITGKIDLSTATFVDDVCEVTVQATANTTSGKGVQKTATIVVVKPISATLVIGETNVAFVGTTVTPELTFNGPDTSFDISVKGWEYSGDKDGNNPLVLEPKLNLSELDGFVYADNKLSFQINEANGSLVEGANFSFTATVDGVLSKDISIEVKNATLAAVKFNYNQLYRAGRPNYHIGTEGVVYFADLFTIANEDKFGDKVTVTIYGDKESSGYLSRRNEITKLYEANPDLYSLTADYPTEITRADWETAKFEFSGTMNAGNIYIEIKPADDIATVVHVEIANGATNFNKADATFVEDGANSYYTLPAGVNDLSNTVIHTDLTINTGSTITVGENATLYGNGWIINAEKYVGTTTKTDKITAIVPTYKYCKTHGEVGDWHKLTNWFCSVSDKNTKDFSNVFNSGNYYLINVNGGKVDNIYVNGPIYPYLQYKEIDYTTSDGKTYSATQYYVSGVNAQGNSTISNSYIEGFRQPVKAEGTNLTVENTTLYGGNYANLNMITGKLDLTNVTTVQPEDGIPSTEFGATHNVIGVGIMVENTAIAEGMTESIITINGYLDQFNWLTYDTDAILPKVEVAGVEVDLKIVLAAMFNGLKVSFVGQDIDRGLGFLDLFKTKNGDNKMYFNSGIVFMHVDKTSEGLVAESHSILEKEASHAETTDPNKIWTAIDENNRTSPKFTSHLIDLFSTYWIQVKGADVVTADKLVNALEEFTIDPTTGKATANLGAEIVDSLSNPIDVCMMVWSYAPGSVVRDANGYFLKWNDSLYNSNYGK